MKKLLLGTAALVSICNVASAQLPVSTVTQNRKVVLEEFTGIHCGYCSDGHKRANQLQASKPAGSVILVNIHTGGYAAPSAGEPDFRTSEGAAIAAISGMNITGYPTGSINRHLFTGQPGFTLNRGQWAAYADSILAKPSYVNVALQGTLNVQTRQLTVDVEAYYTGNSTASANNLTVMLLEDNILGPQLGSDAFYPSMIQIDGSYTHNHMLRKVLTPAATGEAISPNTAGATITKSYSYTVPTQFINNPSYLGNLRLVAFIAEGNSEIVTAAYGPISLTNVANANDGQLMANLLSENEVCKGDLNPIVKVFNNGSAAIATGTIEASVNGVTASTFNFNKTIAPFTFEFVQVPTVSFAPATSNTLSLNLTHINGAPDPVTTGNASSKANILLTTRVATKDSVTMAFTQDQYGSESTWKVIEEATGSVVAQGGPYANLASVGTLTHTVTFKVKPTTCYKVIVLDAYGDGINGGAGAGGFNIKSNGMALYTSNGKFTSKDESVFKTASNLAVSSVPSFASSVSISPNPARDEAVLSLSLDKATKVTIAVVDMMGRTVDQVANTNVSTGNQQFRIATSNLSAGIYNIRVTTEEGTFSQRLSVTK